MNIGIITGASSGMGKEFVKLTMQNHLELDEIWVIARRKERLEAWSDLYKEQKFRILSLDLQKKERYGLSWKDIGRSTTAYRIIYSLCGIWYYGKDSGDFYGRAG